MKKKLREEDTVSTAAERLLSRHRICSHPRKTPPPLLLRFASAEDEAGVFSGRYELLCEKSHPSSLLHYSHAKSTSQVTIAHLKEKSAQAATTAASSSSSSNGVRSADARLLGSSNGGRALGFMGGNGTSKAANGVTKNVSYGLSNGMGCKRRAGYH